MSKVQKLAEWKQVMRKHVDQTIAAASEALMAVEVQDPNAAPLVFSFKLRAQQLQLHIDQLSVVEMAGAEPEERKP